MAVLWGGGVLMAATVTKHRHHGQPSVLNIHTPCAKLRDIGIDGGGIQGIVSQIHPVPFGKPRIIEQGLYVAIWFSQSSSHVSLVRLARGKMLAMWLCARPSVVSLVRLARGEMSLIWLPPR